jgi:hypothetical protein
MKKTPLFILILVFLVFSLAGIAHSWQGRMAGMGDPYGLIKDESDFLIHPAGIAKGQGINFYGHYRFDWRGVPDWDYTLDFGPGIQFPYRSSGDQQEHNGLLGAAFPLGPGRMGLFFQYAGKRGNFDGKEDLSGPPLQFNRYDLKSDLDAFSLRLLYGLPIGVFKLGGEIQLAYRQEQNETFFDQDSGVGIHSFWTNNIFGSSLPNINTFPFMFPYDSNYWEALFKGSLKGEIGPVKIAFTAWGGIIFGGDNKLEANYIDTTLASGSIDLDGKVKGWRMGGDFWLRYSLAKDLSFPFLIKIEYQKKSRDGDGLATGIFGPGNADYKNEEKVLQLEAGGGLDKELAKGTRIAGGIYYGYVKNKNNFILNGSSPGPFSQVWDHSNYPDQTEHRVILRLAGEKELSPVFVMRMGLNFFYGWVKEDLRFTYADTFPSSYSDKISLDGSHWGIGASLGGTIKFERFSLEPFLGGGYQKLNLSGDGNRSGGAFLFDMDKIRKEWSVGGGLSIKF